MCELQAKFKVEAILENERVFGKGELQLKSITFLKNCKLMVIDILRLGWVCMGCS
jgi:hypothetical protein